MQSRYAAAPSRRRKATKKERGPRSDAGGACSADATALEAAALGALALALAAVALTWLAAAARGRAARTADEMSARRRRSSSSSGASDGDDGDADALLARGADLGALDEQAAFARELARGGLFDGADELLFEDEDAADGAGSAAGASGRFMGRRRGANSRMGAAAGLPARSSALRMLEALEALSHEAEGLERGGGGAGVPQSLRGLLEQLNESAGGENAVRGRDGGGTGRGYMRHSLGLRWNSLGLRVCDGGRCSVGSSRSRR